MNEHAERRRRIRFASTGLKFLAAFITLLAVVMSLGAWVVPVGESEPESPGSSSPGFEAKGAEDGCCNWFVRMDSEWPGSDSVRAGRDWMVKGVMSFVFAYAGLGGFLFMRLFQAFQRGEFFGKEAVGWIKKIGLWVFGWWGVETLAQLSKLGWSESPYVQIEVGPELLAGLLIYLVAWIMDEGRELSEEQALTV